MPGSVIVSGKRTPIGKLSGAFAGMTAGDLGAVAIKGALEAAGISGEQVEYVIMGQVIQAGNGQNPARKASTDAGIPMSTPSFTLNKVCLSGLDAIALADQMIQAGEYDIVVAGGMESMTEGPYLLPKARRGYKYGGGTILDATESDGLTDVYDHESMGASTERFASSIGLSREEMDEVSAASHQRAADAAKNGRFEAEIAPVPVPQRKGDPIEVTEDEGVRGDTTAEGLGKLKAGVREGGRHHGGQRLAGLGRRGRDGRHVRPQGRGARHPAAGRDPDTTAGSPAPTTPCSRSPPTPRSRRCAARASSPRTSRSGRSTRRSRRSRSSPPASWACRPTRSTPTAAPSRSATRSAPPAPASPCTRPTSSSAAAVAAPWPACAAAAARARR